MPRVLASIACETRDSRSVQESKVTQLLLLVQRGCFSHQEDGTLNWTWSWSLSFSNLEQLTNKCLALACGSSQKKHEQWHTQMARIFLSVGVSFLTNLFQSGCEQTSKSTSEIPSVARILNACGRWVWSHDLSIRVSLEKSPGWSPNTWPHFTDSSEVLTKNHLECNEDIEV